MHLELPCSVGHADLVHAVAEQVGRHAGLDDQACLDVGLAVREALVNAMKHGNGLESSKPVEVLFRVLPEGMEVSIRDRGEGFDPEEVADPTSPENLTRTSGRGLLIIRSFVDQLRIRRRRGGGTEVVLLKETKEKVE